MTAAAVAHDALERASTGQSVSNYPAIISGFADKGVPEAEIRPRENVFTFHAWKALGRSVRKGEHGVRVTTWVPVEERRDESGQVTRPAGRRPKTAVVFHVSQTDAIGDRSGRDTTHCTHPGQAWCDCDWCRLSRTVQS